MTSVSRARIYEAVSRIPRGKVATYGQIAVLAGMRGHARQVGYALAALPDATKIPWHRVINARACISDRRVTGAESTQHQLLEREGVKFDELGRIPLARFRWKSGKSDTLD